MFTHFHKCVGQAQKANIPRKLNLSVKGEKTLCYNISLHLFAHSFFPCQIYRRNEENCMPNLLPATVTHNQTRKTFPKFTGCWFFFHNLQILRKQCLLLFGVAWERFLFLRLIENTRFSSKALSPDPEFFSRDRISLWVLCLVFTFFLLSIEERRKNWMTLTHKWKNKSFLPPPTVFCFYPSNPSLSFVLFQSRGCEFRFCSTYRSFFWLWITGQKRPKFWNFK